MSTFIIIIPQANYVFIVEKLLQYGNPDTSKWRNLSIYIRIKLLII